MNWIDFGVLVQRSRSQWPQTEYHRLDPLSLTFTWFTNSLIRFLRSKVKGQRESCWVNLFSLPNSLYVSDVSNSLKSFVMIHIKEMCYDVWTGSQSDMWTSSHYCLSQFNVTHSVPTCLKHDDASNGSVTWPNCFWNESWTSDDWKLNLNGWSVCLWTSSLLHLHHRIKLDTLWVSQLCVEQYKNAQIKWHL